MVSQLMVVFWEKVTLTHYTKLVITLPLAAEAKHHVY